MPCAGRDGKLADARKAFAPIVYDSHGHGAAKSGQAAIARIAASDAKGAQTAMERSGEGAVTPAVSEVRNIESC